MTIGPVLPRFIVTPDGISRRNPLTGLGERRNNLSMLFGQYAVWECNHCTERRVWGNLSPPRDSRKATLKCQVSGKHEPHSFVEMSGEWVGKKSPLPLYPIGGLPSSMEPYDYQRNPAKV